MARRLVAAESDYLEYGAAVVRSLPLSFGLFFRIDAIGIASPTLFTVCNSGSSTDGFELLASTDGTVWAALLSGGGGVSAVTIGTWTLGRWHHALAVHVSTSERRVYLDGGNKGTNATFRAAPTGLNRTVIGRRTTPTPGQYLDGAVARAGIWKGVLSDGDARDLAMGKAPRRVRPDLYVDGWELNMPGALEPSDSACCHPMTVFGAERVMGPPLLLRDLRRPLPFVYPSTGSQLSPYLLHRPVLGAI